MSRPFTFTSSAAAAVTSAASSVSTASSTPPFGKFLMACATHAPQMCQTNTA